MHIDLYTVFGLVAIKMVLEVLQCFETVKAYFISEIFKGVKHQLQIMKKLQGNGGISSGSLDPS